MRTLLDEMNNIEGAALGRMIFFDKEIVAHSATHVLILTSLQSNSVSNYDPKICLSMHAKTSSGTHNPEPIKVWGTTVKYNHEESMREGLEMLK